MEKEYVVNDGQHFTIEWYYNSDGKSKALEYFTDLMPGNQDKLLYLIK